MVATNGYYHMAEAKASNHMSRLLLTDGSLLFLIVTAVIEVERQRNNARNSAQDPDYADDRHRSNMYHLPREDFPRELYTRLHSAHAG